MVDFLANRVHVETGTNGTGDFTLGTQISNSYQSFVTAGIPNGATFPYTAYTATQFECGKGSYLTAGGILDRTAANVVAGSAGAGVLVNFSANPRVFIGPLAETIVTTERLLTAGPGLVGGGALAADLTFSVGPGTGIVVNADDVALAVPVSVANGGNGTTTGLSAAATTALAGKEPTIAPGTTAQYWRGDKTWQTLPVSSVGGSATQVQFNNAGVFDGSPNLTWVSPALTIGVAASTRGQLKLTGSTSGTLTLMSPDVFTSYSLIFPISPGTTGQVLQSQGAGVGMAWGSVAATQGGTGLTTYAIGDLLSANATTTLSRVAAVAAGSALISNGVGVVPAWGKINLATGGHTTGVLPVASGGTGSSTAAAAPWVDLTGDTMSGALAITAVTASSSVDTGALTVDGGVGVNGALYTGDGLYVTRNAATGVSMQVTNTNSANAAMVKLISSPDTGASFFSRGSTMSNYGNMVQNSFCMYNAHAAGMAFMIDANGPFTWSTNAAIRMTLAPTTLSVALDANTTFRVDVNGNIGPASNIGAFIKTAGNVFGLQTAATTGTVGMIGFWDGTGTLVGNIFSDTAANTTSYGGSSDIRLKPERLPYEGAGAIIDAIRVYNHSWRGKSKRGVGMAAQELYEIFPLAVVPGDADDVPVTKQGFIPWMTDNSKLVPVLIADAQETHRRIEALEKALLA